MNSKMERVGRTDADRAASSASLLFMIRLLMAWTDRESEVKMSGTRGSRGDSVGAV